MLTFPLVFINFVLVFDPDCVFDRDFGFDFNLTLVFILIFGPNLIHRLNLVFDFALILKSDVVYNPALIIDCNLILDFALAVDFMFGFVDDVVVFTFAFNFSLVFGFYFGSDAGCHSLDHAVKSVFGVYQARTERQVCLESGRVDSYAPEVMFL